MLSIGSPAVTELADRRSTSPPQTRSSTLLERFRQVRARSLSLAAPLSAEDQTVQSMPDASPTKWHLAHTTWFLETFLLTPTGVPVFDPAFGFLFNSYYEALGARHPRPARGLVTRPSAQEVALYRAHVDEAVERLLERERLDEAALDLLTLGLAHEEQHQELILTDILHMLAQNAMKPAYRRAPHLPTSQDAARPMGFVGFGGGVVEIGSQGGEGFAFDNEGPAHPVLLQPYRLADRLVVNAEWLAFIEDGGYRRAELWLSDGWAYAGAHGWTAPLYWEQDEGGDWSSFTLDGLQPLEPAAPVTHVSLYEADAFARWRGLRLPSEAEWEHAARDLPVRGVFLESGRLSPAPAPASGDGVLRQMFGDVWEWTASPYSPYPRFRAAAGAVGEYNGKFMINQMVLRGGSCVTPRDHVRASYRNFFQPHQRWQFSGVRLAADD